MKRLLFVALMLICSASHAGWDVLFPSDEYMYFYNKYPAKRESRIVKMWSAISYYKEQPTSAGKIVSYINLSSYDCRNKKIQVMFSKMSPVRFTVSNFDTYKFEQRLDGWSKVSPGSIGDQEWKIACQQ